MMFFHEIEEKMFFHEIEEKRVDDPRGNLTCLSKYTKGDANR